MDVYMYQAALYCDACGEKIREDLDAKGLAPEDPDDEYSYDSDEYPKGPFPDGGGESDSPEHCDSHEHCLQAEELFWNGKSVGKVGAFLENDLTSDGVKYLAELVSQHGRKASDYQKALYKFWIDYYKNIDARVVANAIREYKKGRYVK